MCPDVTSHEGLQECSSALRRQRVEPELRIIRLAPPVVAKLGTVADEQEHAGGRQTLDQVVQEGLRLGVDPVEVLDHQTQRLDLAFSQQQILHGIHDALTALRRIEGLRLGVVDRYLQEHQECRNDWLQSRFQRQEFVSNLVPYRL
jgi:hypothetical protein